MSRDSIHLQLMVHLKDYKESKEIDRAKNPEKPQDNAFTRGDDYIPFFETNDDGKPHVGTLDAAIRMARYIISDKTETAPEQLISKIALQNARLEKAYAYTRHILQLLYWCKAFTISYPTGKVAEALLDLLVSMDAANRTDSELTTDKQRRYLLNLMQKALKAGQSFMALEKHDVVMLKGWEASKPFTGLPVIDGYTEADIPELPFGTNRS